MGSSSLTGIAAMYKCNKPDGISAGYTYNKSQKLSCEKGSFCYQLGEGVYCGVGSASVVSGITSFDKSRPIDTYGRDSQVYRQGAQAAANCSTANKYTCVEGDGLNTGFYSCADNKPSFYNCAKGSSCYQDNAGIYCGSKNSTDTKCGDNTQKCIAQDGYDSHFLKCIDGESVTMSCGSGTVCYQQGPFAVSCVAPGAASYTGKFPANPASNETTTSKVPNQSSKVQYSAQEGTTSVPPTASPVYGESKPETPMSSPTKPMYGETEPESPETPMSSPTKPMYGEEQPEKPTTSAVPPKPVYGETEPEKPETSMSSATKPVYGYEEPEKPTTSVVPPKPTTSAVPPKPVYGYEEPEKPTTSVVPPKPTTSAVPPKPVYGYEEPEKPTTSVVPPKPTTSAVPPKPVYGYEEPEKPTTSVVPPKPTTSAVPPKP
ncbi:hypothetical protein BB559_000125, partial [Furculomyces boomerangus]